MWASRTDTWLTSHIGRHGSGCENKMDKCGNFNTPAIVLLFIDAVGYQLAQHWPPNGWSRTSKHVTDRALTFADMRWSRATIVWSRTGSPAPVKQNLYLFFFFAPLVNTFSVWFTGGAVKMKINGLQSGILRVSLFGKITSKFIQIYFSANLDLLIHFTNTMWLD